MPLRRRQHGGDRGGRHQRGRAAAEEDRSDPPPRQRLRLIGQVGEQRVLPRRLVHACADMAVEVAIGAFRDAERPMDIEGEIVGHRIRSENVHLAPLWGRQEAGGSRAFAFDHVGARMGEPGFRHRSGRPGGGARAARPGPAGRASADDPLRGTMLAMHNATRRGSACRRSPGTRRSPTRREAMPRIWPGPMSSATPRRRCGGGRARICGSDPRAYDYAAMATAWTDEARLFVNQPTPMFSITGHWQDVGHYSQIVWRSTTALGCAMASARPSTMSSAAMARRANVIVGPPSDCRTRVTAGIVSIVNLPPIRTGAIAPETIE